MARLAAIFALAICVCWAGPLPISTGVMVPGQMKHEVRIAQNNRACPIEFYIGNVCTAYTAVCWLRYPPGNDSIVEACPSASCSVHPARATYRGGKQSDFPTPTYDYQEIALDANGQWVMPGELPAATNAHYAAAGTAWLNGCYSVNIFTPCDVTLTVAGGERNFGASNEMQRAEVLAVNSSRSVALSAADPSAIIYFGIRENPPKQFFGAIMGETRTIGINNITNEWIMVASTVYIDANQNVQMSASMRDWDRLIKDVQSEGTQAVPRSTFAVDSTMRFHICGDTAASPGEYELYGWKCFRGTLTETQLDRVRDLDKLEMQRRGMARMKNE